MSTATSSRQMPAAPVHRGWMTLPWLAATAITVIWAAVIVISVFSPDLVSGTQQDHTPVAGILTWIWGLIATRALITTLAAQRGRPGRVGDVAWLVAGVSAAWAAAAAVAVSVPELVTGADPTHLPLAAIIAPIAAMVITSTACQLFSSLHPDGKQSAEAQARGAGE
jgi:hypothetical protein